MGKNGSWSRKRELKGKTQHKTPKPPYFSLISQERIERTHSITTSFSISFNWSRKRELKVFFFLVFYSFSSFLISQERIERNNLPHEVRPIIPIWSRKRELKAINMAQDYMGYDGWSRKRELKVDTNAPTNATYSLWSRKRELKGRVVCMKKMRPVVWSRKRELKGSWRSPTSTSKTTDLARENWKDGVESSPASPQGLSDLARENWKWPASAGTTASTSPPWSRKRELKERLGCQRYSWQDSWSRKRELKDDGFFECFLTSNNSWSRKRELKVKLSVKV